MAKEAKQDKWVTICVLGKTGCGKSTLLNRIFGDDSLKGNKGDFVAANSVESVTKDPESISRKIIINEGPLSKYNINICLVDTPGITDADQTSKEIAKKLKDFFDNTCSKVNVFLMVFNLTDIRYDSNTQDLLKQLELLFKPEIWKHVMIVFTHYDDNSYTAQDDYELAKKAWPNRIKLDFKLKFDIPTTYIGYKNYEKCVNDVITFGIEAGQYKVAIPSCFSVNNNIWKYDKINNLYYEVPLKNVKNSDYILSYDINNHQIITTKVWRYSQHNLNGEKMLLIKLNVKNEENNNICCIILTNDHWLFLYNNNNPIAAGNIQVNNYLWLYDNNRMVCAKVIGIERVYDEICNIYTDNGTAIVNNILSSCYVEPRVDNMKIKNILTHNMIHQMNKPYRIISSIYPEFGYSNISNQLMDNIRNQLYQIANKLF